MPRKKIEPKQDPLYKVGDELLRDDKEVTITGVSWISNMGYYSYNIAEDPATFIFEYELKKPRKVRVKSCAYDTWWYTRLVGQEVEIKYRELKEDYLALHKYVYQEGKVSHEGYLFKSDCELIE